MAHADGKEIVSVLRGLGSDAAGNGTAGARAIFDDELLAQCFGQSVGKNARGNIGSTAGTKPDQNVNRLRRPILRARRWRRHCDGQGRRHSRRNKGAFHDRPPYVRRASPTGRACYCCLGNAFAHRVVNGRDGLTSHPRWDCAKHRPFRSRFRRYPRPSSRPAPACAHGRRRMACP